MKELNRQWIIRWPGSESLRSQQSTVTWNGWVWGQEEDQKHGVMRWNINRKQKKTKSEYLLDCWNWAVRWQVRQLRDIWIRDCWPTVNKSCHGLVIHSLSSLRFQNLCFSVTALPHNSCTPLCLQGMVSSGHWRKQQVVLLCWKRQLGLSQTVVILVLPILIHEREEELENGMRAVWILSGLS